MYLRTNSLGGRQALRRYVHQSVNQGSAGPLSKGLQEGEEEEEEALPRPGHWRWALKES